MRLFSYYENHPFTDKKKGSTHGRREKYERRKFGILKETIQPGTMIGVMRLITGVILERKRANLNQHPDGQ